MAAEPVRFGGQDFYQTDWRRQYESYFGKYAMYSRGYTTLRNGYEITFSFRADSKKGVEALARSMESLKFEAGK